MTARLSCLAETAGCAALVIAGTLGLCLPCPLIRAGGLGLVLFAFACMAEERMRWHRDEAILFYRGQVYRSQGPVTITMEGE